MPTAAPENTPNARSRFHGEDSGEFCASDSETRRLGVRVSVESVLTRANEQAVSPSR